MANILSADDATFAGGQGNWTPGPYGATLSTAGTPTSPGGNRVLVITKTSSAYLVADAQIIKGFYPAVLGQHFSLDLEVNVPGTNTGTGLLHVQALVVTYKNTGGGIGEGDTTSTSFNPGSGWHHISVPDFAVGRSGTVWVGIEIIIAPDINSSPHGFATGDVAYISDVFLGVPVVGGWGVGQIRMGAN